MRDHKTKKQNRIKLLKEKQSVRDVEALWPREGNEKILNATEMDK